MKMGPGGMEALVALGGGDMRRSLNILQVELCEGWGKGRRRVICAIDALFWGTLVLQSSLIRSLSLEIKGPHQGIEVAFNPLVVGCGFYLLPAKSLLLGTYKPHPRLKALLI